MTRRVLLVLHPWLTAPAEREALRAAAAGLGAEVDAVEITGSAEPASMAARLAEQLHATRALVLLPAGLEGEQISACLAAATGAAILGRCSRIRLEGDAVLARRRVFGGRAEVALRSEARVVCAALRPGAVASSAHGAALQGSELAVDADPAFAREAVPSHSAHPRVEGAALVVSGGRGISGTEGFDLLARVAGALGAGLGGSLPAVDAGWVPVAHQVGQSGKFVTPRVYFAVGISGTPQHMAGVAPTARIIALNNDPHAPIFGRCDVGVEGDWREILPLLVERLEAAPEG